MLTQVLPAPSVDVRPVRPVQVVRSRSRGQLPDLRCAASSLLLPVDGL
ncbi:hypothetical protein [Leptolyngbya sp. FACHB-16]|nr:hypothetical protein [Leptolyngbya sp. FACHB-16]MBD2153151.1 hypothetical protein [Leptolyngbya sp. FACHB-16]